MAQDYVEVEQARKGLVLRVDEGDGMEQSKWVSVSDRLPSKVEPVLVSLLCREKPPARVWMIASWIAGERRWADACDDVDLEAGGDSVTHWVALPAHPT